jgi:hypothetical protein
MEIFLALNLGVHLEYRSVNNPAGDMIWMP